MASKQSAKKPAAPVKAKPEKAAPKAQAKPLPKAQIAAKPAQKTAATAAPVKAAEKAPVKAPVKAAKASTKAAIALPQVMGIVKSPTPLQALSAAPTIKSASPVMPVAPPLGEAAAPGAEKIIIGKAAAGGALTLSVQTSQGNAANGNTQPANILVLVSAQGAPVVDLTKDHFTLMEHFEVPGQMAPFSNNISSFRNAGTGAYLLQTKPITGAPWRSGHHLAQLLVSDDEDRQGQVAFKLIIR